MYKKWNGVQSKINMINIKTRVLVLDNSGAKEAEIIRVLKNKNQTISIGDTVIVAIKKAATDKKVKKHDVRTGVVIQTKKKIMTSAPSPVLRNQKIDPRSRSSNTQGLQAIRFKFPC